MLHLLWKMVRCLKKGRTAPLLPASCNRLLRANASGFLVAFPELSLGACRCAGGRPHSAQPGLPRHSKPQQEGDCSSARVATVTFADHPADPFPRMQSRPRPSSAQPIAAKERASRAVAGAGNQPQRHLEAGGRDDSTVPCSSPGGGADPAVRAPDLHPTSSASRLRVRGCAWLMMHLKERLCTKLCVAVGALF